VEDEPVGSSIFNIDPKRYAYKSPTLAITRMNGHAKDAMDILGEGYMTSITQMIGLLVADHEDANPELPRCGWSITAEEALDAALRDQAQRGGRGRPDDPMVSAAAEAQLRVNDLVDTNGGQFGAARMLACLLDFDAGAARIIRALGQDPSAWTRRLLISTGDLHDG
jgi:hypothetical protein